MRIVILLLVAVSLCCGCSKRKCVRRTIRSLLIDKSRTSFRDTAALVVRYDKGSNFQNPVDSSEQLFKYVNNPDAPFIASFSYEFDPVWDYRLVFFPSGEVHYLSDLRINHDKISGGLPWGGKEGTLYCSWGYTLNGAVVSNKGYYDDEGTGAGSTSIKLY